MKKSYDVIVVGSGIAGLTSACYLAKAGFSVLVCERAGKPGGLVVDFKKDGFHFDAGLRAMENSGIIKPMLRQLGIGLSFLPNPVSIRIGDDIVRLEDSHNSETLLVQYGAMLTKVFPQNADDIKAILQEIRKVMSMMDVLYGVDNPLFMDLKDDPKYLMQTLLPWLVRYQFNMRKMKHFQLTIQDHMAQMTSNQALIDTIAQHFFRDTPAFFALSYFGLYLDYMYPTGGTGSLIHALTDFLKAQEADLVCGAEIIKVDIAKREVTTVSGQTVQYRDLIWAADMKSLYRAAKSTSVDDPAYQKQATMVKQGRGGDSVMSVFLSLGMPPAEIAKAFGPHSFYTPVTTGLSSLGLDSWKESVGYEKTIARKSLENWLHRYFTLTTYEISCPVLRESALAPKNQSGLIVSTLLSFDLVQEIEKAGWYSDFKDLCVGETLQQIEQALPGISTLVLDAQCSTPLTIQKNTANADGAITGWSFMGEMPAESRFKKIAKSVLTPLPHVFQAGQWSFSPSGLPVSVMTGKMAADAVSKTLTVKKT